jgi:hypothetical protein
MMKKINLALCVSAALFAPILVGTSAAQSAQWTATSSPIQATIAGGPWTLSQGGTATTGGAYNGTIPYCTPGGASGGTPLMNSTSVVNTFSPYYFPFVVGNGQNVKGYFDYRPKDINEAVVEATSTNAGQSWTFQAIAEQLSTECPNSNSNTANDTPGGNPAGNDDGEGHPSIISYGSAEIMYTLNRSNGHVDSDGLIAHQLKPTGGNPLNPLPAVSPLMQPPTANVIAGWNFDNDANTATSYPTITGGSTPTFNVDISPAPSTNNVTTSTVPAASALGMTNSYNYTTQAASIHAAGSGYAVGDTGTFGSSGGTYTVTSLTSGGTGVKAVTISAITTGYTVGTNYPATATTGSGTGLSLKVTGTQTTGSVNGNDVTPTTLSSDPLIVAANNSLAAENVAPNDNNAWRIRGVGTASGSGQGSVVGNVNTGNGWNNAAPPCTQGAQFMVDTTGYKYVILQFDWYTTNQGVRDLQVLYTTNGGSTWTPVGPIQVSGGGSVFNNQITINFKALGITSVENNPNFGVQLVSVYDPDFIPPSGSGLPAYSIPTSGNVCSAGATGIYTAASLTSAFPANQPVQYNNNSGNWRFDEVNILGTANNTNPITSDPIVNTTGLVNPDGILAVVPNTYPIEVLYVSKTLTSDYVAPTSYPLCPASIPNGNFNDDVEVVRLATTTNFVSFTDITPTNPVPSSTTGQTLQMVAGLSDPATTSYSGIRWIAPNGTLIKLSTGNWGLFFGGGNCLDGDSDAFHAIMYAESPDLKNWTVVNGINNPIASIAQQTGLTDPQTGATNVTIPANTPLIGQSVAGGLYDWFSGRVYGPQAIVTSPNTVSLIFSGYNAGFQLGGSSRDFSNYRNIGQVNLSVSNVTLP